jgi:hypothetical protein
MFKCLKFKIAYKFGNEVKVADVKEMTFNHIMPEKVSIEILNEVEGGEPTKETISIPIDFLDSNLMECTTKYDREGYMIYTGMVVEREEGESKKRYVVTFFDAGFFAFNPDNEEDYGALNEAFSSGVKIIGNIYQSPELGEKKIDFNKVVENAEKNPEVQQ